MFSPLRPLSVLLHQPEQHLTEIKINDNKRANTANATTKDYATNTMVLLKHVNKITNKQASKRDCVTEVQREKRINLVWLF